MPFEAENLQTLLARTIQIVLQAGEIIREQSRGPLAVRHKGPTDLVTQTDLAVEDFLFHALNKLESSIGFLGEEGAAAGNKVCLNSPVWIVDPVDGTTNYAHGLPFVATSVGLWSGSRMALGVVNCPLLGECFYAARGLGAWLGSYQTQTRQILKPDPACNQTGTELFAATRQLRVSTTLSLQNSLLATGFPYEAEPNLPVILKRLKQVLPATQGLRRCGAAAIDLAYVAAGRFDAYYEEWLKPWDVAAGWLLVEEAGGQVGDLRGAPYHLEAPGIIAANPKIFSELAALLNL